MSRCRSFWHRSKPEHVNISAGCLDNHVPCPGSAFRCRSSTNAVDAAFERLYNFDFPAAHALLNAHLKNQPSDSLAYAVRASAVLFEELHRLRILESEFFAEDKRIIDKQALRPAPEARSSFNQALRAAEREAQKTLTRNPDDAEALFALSLVAGLEADYLAFIEKRQLQSLSFVRQSQTLSLRLLKAHPDYADAELSGGACEYLLGTMPFFVKWFLRIDGVEGQKSAAARKLQRSRVRGDISVRSRGSYWRLCTFARSSRRLLWQCWSSCREISPKIHCFDRKLRRSLRWSCAFVNARPLSGRCRVRAGSPPIPPSVRGLSVRRDHLPCRGNRGRTNTPMAFRAGGGTRSSCN